YRFGADLFPRLERISISYHSKHSLGDALNRVNGDAWCVYALAERVINMPLMHGVTLVKIGAVAWQIDHSLALISLIIAPVLGVSTFHFARRVKAISEEGRVTQANLFGSVQQALST